MRIRLCAKTEICIDIDERAYIGVVFKGASIMNPQTSLALTVGQNQPYEVHDYDAANNDLGIDAAATVSSSDPSIVSFSENGNGTGTVTGVAEGSATLVFTSGAFSATVSVTVSTTPPVVDHIGVVFPTV